MTKAKKETAKKSWFLLQVFLIAIPVGLFCYSFALKINTYLQSYSTIILIMYRPTAVESSTRAMELSLAPEFTLCPTAEFTMAMLKKHNISLYGPWKSSSIRQKFPALNADLQIQKLFDLNLLVNLNQQLVKYQFKHSHVTWVQKWTDYIPGYCFSGKIESDNFKILGYSKDAENFVYIRRINFHLNSTSPFVLYLRWLYNCRITGFSWVRSITIMSWFLHGPELPHTTFVLEQNMRVLGVSVERFFDLEDPYDPASCKQVENYDTCIQDSRKNMLKERKDCYSPFYYWSNDTKIFYCDTDSEKDLKKIEETLQYNSEVYCGTPCNDTIVSTIYFEDDTKSLMKPNTIVLGNNKLRPILMILIIELPVNQRQQKVTLSYGPIDLLSDFGGFMGLYIGVSLLPALINGLTFIETIFKSVMDYLF